MLGLGPDQLAGLTLRELMWMAEGRGAEAWARTSLVAALLVNIHRDPKKGRPVKADDFNPYATGRRDDSVIKIDKSNIGLLRGAFTTGQREIHHDSNAKHDTVGSAHDPGDDDDPRL